MKLLFTFENELPNRMADAEVFLHTAKALAERVDACLLIPGKRSELTSEGALRVRRCRAPLRFALFRHVYMALSLAFRAELKRCDAVYTRNLLVAVVAILAGRAVIFDHYRPWGDQLPPLQPFLRWLLNHERLWLAVCHSHLTRRAYERIGIDPQKLVTIHAGFDPNVLQPASGSSEAKRRLGFAEGRPLAVYTGRVNHKKGLDVLLAAARLSPEIQVAIVGGEGGTAIEDAALEIENVSVIGFQPQAQLAQYLHAADVLVIPPASSPLEVHGSTVLPLKTFLYLGAEKPIVAGRSADNAEVLEHGVNALLVEPDAPDALARALRRVVADRTLAARLESGARTSARTATWSERARRILGALAERPEPRLRPSWLRETAAWFCHVIRTRRWAMPCRYSIVSRKP